MSPLTISMFTYLSVIPIFSLIFIYDNFQGAVQGIFISLYHHIRSLQYQGFWMLAAGASWFPNISASSLLELIAHLQAWDCSQNLDLFFFFFSLRATVFRFLSESSSWNILVSQIGDVGFVIFWNQDVVIHAQHKTSILQNFAEGFGVKFQWNKNDILPSLSR